MRQIFLDTETTGLEPEKGHKIIEIGCVEMINRRLTGNNYHVYLNPERDIDDEAIEVHGLTNEFLEDKPLFEYIAEEFLEFVKGAELIIHNAPFDVGFLNHELKQVDSQMGQIKEHCRIFDTLTLARKMHPGQKNSLDALCKRYAIDNSRRTLHGALLDSEILAEVYLAMTGGQVDLTLSHRQENKMAQKDEAGIRRLSDNREAFKILKANQQELEAHQAYLEEIKKQSGDKLIWQ
ncbi:MAG: DNA polymerase III subunit epsilon [Gammaproteobacteria bacterium]|nr:DNA polymerase III subunit epsilon [Gammaproteobacteria bacterium]MDH5628896.1 DNA polymerase III subunit epsilon [Gammaproteobacteria bacterium]